MDGIEYIWLELHFPRSRSCQVCFVYRPPSYKAVFTGLLEEMLSSSDCQGIQSLVLGDVNFDLLETPRPSATKDYKNVFQALGFQQLITKVTRPISNSLLDHIFVSNKDFFIDFGTIPLSLSDHLPVFVTWRTTSNFKRLVYKIIHFRSRKSISIDNFVDDLSRTPWTSLGMFSDPNMRLIIGIVFLTTCLTRTPR